MTVMDAEINKRYLVKEVLGGGNARRRLLDMGFSPGSPVYVAAVSPFGGTVLVNLRGTMIALREDAASVIEIGAI